MVYLSCGVCTFYSEWKSIWSPSELVNLLLKQSLKLLDHVEAPGDEGLSREGQSDGT